MTRDEFVKKFKVGDKIKLPYFSAMNWIRIDFIGQKTFYATDENGDENTQYFDEKWLHYEEPKKETLRPIFLKSFCQGEAWDGTYYVVVSNIETNIAPTKIVIKNFTYTKQEDGTQEASGDLFFEVEE